MIPPVKRPPVSEKDIDTLARTIYGEARGESRLGRIAVAWVVRNRAAKGATYLRASNKPHPAFGSGSLDAAARGPKQFSCWNAGDPNLDLVCTVTDIDPAFRECLDVARAVADGTLADPTGGATHYHTIVRPAWAATWPPLWVQGRKPSVTIGAHVFYSGVL